MQLNTKVKNEDTYCTCLRLPTALGEHKPKCTSGSDGLHSRLPNEVWEVSRTYCVVQESAFESQTLVTTLPSFLLVVPSRTLKFVILLEQASLKPGSFQREQVAVNLQIHLS